MIDDSVIFSLLRENPIREMQKKRIPDNADILICLYCIKAFDAKIYFCGKTFGFCIDFISEIGKRMDKY